MHRVCTPTAAVITRITTPLLVGQLLFYARPRAKHFRAVILWAAHSSTL